MPESFTKQWVRLGCSISFPKVVKGVENYSYIAEPRGAIQRDNTLQNITRGWIRREEVWFK